MHGMQFCTINAGTECNSAPSGVAFIQNFSIGGAILNIVLPILVIGGALLGFIALIALLNGNFI